MATEGPLVYIPPVTGPMQHPHHAHAIPPPAGSFTTPSLSSEWYSNLSPPTYHPTSAPALDRPYHPNHTTTVSEASPVQSIQSSYPEPEPLSIQTVGVSSYDSAPGVPTRPHSSPSTFGPSPDELIWPPSNPLRISTVMDHYGHPASYPPHPPPPKLLSPPQPHPLETHGFHDLKTPQPSRYYQSIAPNPMGMVRMHGNKRSREEDESPESAAKRRQRSTSSAVSSELGEEDRLLFKLKDEENLPWKDIAARFKTDLGKTYQVPALQMRFKRLRERLRVWTDVDVNALRMAHEYWQKNKFEIIASKMVEFGSAEKWSARQCARKWQEIAPNSEFYMNAASVPTPFSQTSSPVDGPGYISFLNLP